jgi:hypothetical protein
MYEDDNESCSSPVKAPRLRINLGNAAAQVELILSVRLLFNPNTRPEKNNYEYCYIYFI